MSGVTRPFVTSERWQQSRGPVDSVGGRDTGIISLYGPFRAPVTGELRHRILAQLRRGERIVIVDLSHVSSIDAAGVGQLVRAYNVTRASHGTLRIVHATRWVRELLERAGLFSLLSPARTPTRCRGLRAIAHGVSRGEADPLGCE
jgi:anti-anti-sigma factor